MSKILNVIALITLLSVFVNCVPTSVLVDTKENKNESPNKVKRTPTLKTENSEKPHLSLSDDKQKLMNTPIKRGLSPQVIPIDLSNDILVNNMPNIGLWDDTDTYSDMQEKEELRNKMNHQKSYENLQNILNSQLYNEPVALPLEYPYRYYGDRKKRSNGLKSAKSTLRLKRENNKLTAADMLALLALLEAEGNSRYNDDLSSNDISNSLLPYEYYPSDENTEWLNSYEDPNIDFYGLSNNGKYDYFKVPNDNRLPSKRFMISKKKRSSIYNNRDWRYGQEKFLTGPQRDSNYEYGRYSLPDILDNSQRSYRHYY